MNTQQVKFLLRAAGFWGSTAKIMTKLHGCSLSPSVNTARVTFSRSLVLWNRHFALSSSPNMPVKIPRDTGGLLVAPGILLPKSSCVYISRGKSKKSRRKNTYQRQVGAIRYLGYLIDERLSLLMALIFYHIDFSVQL